MHDGGPDVRYGGQGRGTQWPHAHGACRKTQPSCFESWLAPGGGAGPNPSSGCWCTKPTLGFAIGALRAFAPAMVELAIELLPVDRCGLVAPASRRYVGDTDGLLGGFAGWTPTARSMGAAEVPPTPCRRPGYLALSLAVGSQITTVLAVVWRGAPLLRFGRRLRPTSTNSFNMASVDTDTHQGFLVCPLALVLPLLSCHLRSNHTPPTRCAATAPRPPPTHFHDPTRQIRCHHVATARRRRGHAPLSSAAASPHTTTVVS